MSQSGPGTSEGSFQLASVSMQFQFLKELTVWYGELIHYNMTEMPEDFLTEDVQEGDCSIP